MATFVTHGLLGAASLAVPARLFGWPPAVRRTLAALGFILGSAPDTFGWIAATFFGAPRWELYNQIHNGIYSAACYIVYPCGLHLVADRLFHPFPGYNWWPDLWWLEVSLGLLGISLTLWAMWNKKAQPPQ
ncbi:MAG: hypothetical protein AAB601_02925 [Patescibacteria group bacterium]